jgi:predicted O-methyltransferase YrrM
MTANAFEIDGIQFVVDYRPGKERGKSQRNEFILVKSKALIEFYQAMAQRRPSAVLEIGMFEGGSLVLFDKLFRPDKLVGIDIRRQPIEPLEEYRAGRDHIQTYYGLSQSDPKLADILKQEFPNGIDLVIDDASHLYEPSRATFEMCFPLLKGGGLYVIEDWSWSHKAGRQETTSGWFDKPALTNLIFDFIISMPTSEQIAQVAVYPHLAVVEKAKTAAGSIDLAEAQKRLRGRSLGRI